VLILYTVDEKLPNPVPNPVTVDLSLLVYVQEFVQQLTTILVIEVMAFPEFLPR